MFSVSLLRRIKRPLAYLILAGVATVAVFSSPQAGLSISKTRTGILMPVKKPVSVKSSMGRIYCKPGTLAFFIDTGNAVAVYDLHSEHRGDITIKTPGQMITTIPGDEVLATNLDGATTFEKSNPLNAISVRDPKLMHENNGIKVYTAEFSITSAVMSIKPLSQMSHSSDAYQRELIDKVLKNAIILNQLRASKGPYKRSR